MPTRVIALLLFSLMAGTGCSEEKQSPGAQAPVTVQVSGDAEEIAVYRALVSAYRRARPDADVRLIEVADKDNHLTKLTTSFAAGAPPDIFLVNFREYSQFVVRGAIDPVQERVEAAGIDLADYYEQPIEAFTYDGVLQCFPQNISSLVVYFNRELFRRGGVEFPAAGWSWEDFRSTGVRLTGGRVRGIGIEPNVIRIAPFVWSNGGELVDDPEYPTRFTFDDPRAREALEFIVGLVRDDEVVPTERDITSEDLESRFVTGKLAMYLSSRRDTPVFRETRGLDWDVAPLPIGREPAGILHSDAYCMSNGSEDPEAAFDFVRFATGRRGQTVTALGGRTVPSLRSVSTSSAFLDPSQPPRNARVFLDGIGVIRRTPVLPTWPEIEDVAEEILTRVFYDASYTIDRGIRELDEATRPLFAEGAA